MGTTGSIKYNDETMAQFIERVELRDERYEILDSAVKLNTAYFAIRNKATGAVEATVVTIQREPGDRDYVYLKSIPEDMGPYYYDCPRRILDKLTLTDNEHANAWRDHCRAFYAKKQAAADLVGKTIDLYGARYQVLDKIKRSYRVKHLGNGAVYRMAPKIAMEAVVV